MTFKFSDSNDAEKVKESLLNGLKPDCDIGEASVEQIHIMGP